MRCWNWSGVIFFRFSVGLCLGLGDALQAGFPIAFVKFKAYEIALGVDAGHGGGARADEGVENYPPR